MSPEVLNPIELLLYQTEKQNKKQICIGRLLSSTIFEQIKSADGTAKYALFQEVEDKKWELTTQGTYENCVPMPQRKNPLSTPYEPIEYESDEVLWNEVNTYIYRHLDIIDETGYNILTAWVFSTWVPELFDYTAYLGFFGRESVGKTRGLEVLNELCFRSWFTTSITTATLFRLIERFNPTLLLDEAEFLNIKEKKELIGLLNAGQRRGLMIPRMSGDRYDKVELFSVYCPKAISGTERLKKTTRSRMIMFNMTKNVRPMPKHLDKETSAVLRSKLLMWRFKKLAELKNSLTFKQKIAIIDQLKARTEYTEIKSLDGRSYELFYSLIYCAPNAATRKVIADFAAELEQVKAREEKVELSSLVFEAIVKLQPQSADGLLYLRNITAYVNSVLDVQYQYGSRKIGAIVSQMGFTKTRRNKGIAIILDHVLIKRLRKDPRYRIELADYFGEASAEVKQKGGTGRGLRKSSE